MTSASITTGIGLFNVDPGFARFIPEADRPLAASVRLPLLELEIGEADLPAAIRSERAFAALVLDGVLLQSILLGTHRAVRLLGPGELISLPDSAADTAALGVTTRATAPTSLALLGRRFLQATARWPWLSAALSARAAAQNRSLLHQMSICQLARVEDRVLEMMWLLAQSWGEVTAGGTLLPLSLTHAVLGELVGARRPTVTLALRELVDRGAIARQPDGWLLMAPSPAWGSSIAAPLDVEPVGDPRPLPMTASAWADGLQRDPAPSVADRVAADRAACDELRRTVDRLAVEHRKARVQIERHLTSSAEARAQATESRRQITRQRLRRRRAPSS